MDYLDFDIEVGQGAGRDYPVRVLHSPAGEARETVYFPFDELALEKALLRLENALLRSGGARRQALSPDQQAVQDFGRSLFETLLTGEVRARYDVSLESAQRQDRGLWVRLRIEAPELAALPWEFLYDHRRAEFVCLSRDTPVVRYLQLPQPIRPLIVSGPLRVLGMIASPTDLPRLDVDQEKERVERATAALSQAGQVELTWLEGESWRSLQRAMRGGPWHVFHFIGHGGFSEVADEGIIFLADEDGRARSLSASQLGLLLVNHRSLRLVFLSACEGARGSKRDVFSSTASILVRKGIPAVVAMQYTITDLAAIDMARAFYEALADGDPVDAAIVEARVAVSLAVHNTVEWGIPVLYMRSPNGLLFELAPGPPGPESATIGADRSKLTVQALVRTTTAPAPAVLAIAQPFPMELAHVPAGEFLMGTRPDDISVLVRDWGGENKEYARIAFQAEVPAHTIWVAEFHVGIFPITNAQYAAYASATGARKPKHWKGGFVPADKESHPVVDVSWKEALAFCQWLSKNSGRSVRLPNEFEWEKAARGTDGRLFPWGNDHPTTEMCNFGANEIWDTTPVDRYPQGISTYGVLDMAGNVLEWTGSVYGSYPYSAEDARDGPGMAGQRVARGGTYGSYAGYIRCAVRYKYSPNHCHEQVGFRVAIGSQ